MAGAQQGGDCGVNWDEQTRYQFEMMINNARARNNHVDADRYEVMQLSALVPSNWPKIFVYTVTKSSKVGNFISGKKNKIETLIIPTL